MKYAFAALFLCCRLCFAATLYVNNSGTPACQDSPTAGSAASPFCTLDYGVTRIASGDTLYVRAGTYTVQNGYLGISGPSGSSSAHTVIAAYPGETVNLLASDTSSKLVFGGLSSCTPVSYVDFSGFQMYGTGGNTWETAVTVNCSSHIALSALTVHNTGQEGIHIFGNSSYVTLTGSTIDNTGTGSLDGEGVYVGSSTSVSTIDNTNNVTISNNTISNTKDEAIELKPGTHDCVVDGNTLYQNNTEGGGYGGAAIEVNEAVSSPQHWDSNPHHIIRNNVIHDTGIPGADAIYNSGIRLGTGSLAYNNVIYNVTSPGYGIYLTNGAFGNTDTYVRYVYHNTLDVSSSNATGLYGGPNVDVRNNIGPTGAGNAQTNSSLYVNQSGRDYHLSANATAAVDQGADLTATVPVDKDGVSRTTWTPPDLGAYEYAGHLSSSVGAGASGTGSGGTGSGGTGGGGAVTGGTGNTINAASCSAADVNSAISSASSGDTVVLPACGATTWGTIVKINKAITLQGQTSCSGKGATLACVDATTISTGVDGAVDLGASNARITGLTITGGTGITSVLVEAGYSNWRIDHVHIGANTSVRGIYVNGGAGLVDHVYFETRNGGIDVEGQNAADGSYPGNYNWTQPLALGSANAVYIEDCKFNWSAQTDGGYDLYNGARVVFRFNDLEGATIGDHGLDSSAGRATLLQEIYDNVSNARSFDTYTFWNTRGGTQMIFDNTTAGWGLFADIRVYRTNNGYGWGNGNSCVSNSNYIDGNTNGHGYPCRDQVGRGPESAPANDWPAKTTGAVFSESLYPTYMWSNTIGGATPTYAASGSGTISVSNAVNASMPNDTSTYEALPNRDFYIQAATFDGTTGVGSGTLAARPSTCTTGVGYWATDQGSWNQSGSGGQGVFYVCTSPNNWTLYYTPYTYPHPLQNGGTVKAEPAAPTDLTGVIS